MPASHPVPSKEDIALLPAFERLALEHVTVVATPAQAAAAAAVLAAAPVWGFDTESKPTFVRNEVSLGPHIVQLATLTRAFIFQLHDEACRAATAALLGSPHAVKAGFGLGDDVRRITTKLGVEPARVLDLNTVFRARGFRKDMGVRAAVAVLFNQRFAKSRKATTSNWAMPRLSEAQLLYAANDAWAALRVYHALGLPA
jgi:ribonuclease D